MVSSSVIPCLVYVVAALVLSAGAAPSPFEPASPCPNLFQYDSVNDPGIWTGNLVLSSDDELYGVWIRLIFDSHPKEVITAGYEVVQPNDGSNEVLLKNRDVLLAAGSAKNVKISVKYDGDKFPNLIGYRLNAKTVCPDSNTNRKDFFEGDDNSPNFLSSILSKVKPTALQPAFECGVIRSQTHPWQASVTLKQGGNGQSICDASLISPSHVLLPAHCVTFRDSTEKIPSGIISVILAGSQEKFGVTKITVHRGYDPDTLSDDLAVLELSSSSSISDSVRPICVEDNISGSEAFLVATDSSGEGRNRIRSASVEVVDAKDCGVSHPEWAGLLQDNAFCGSYSPEKSSCIGRSGSGIFSLRDGDATLIGIVTLLPQNENHCKGDTTVIAADVTRYYKWILRAIS